MAADLSKLSRLSNHVRPTPTVRGRHHAGAMASCAAALDGKLASEFAKDAFARACDEAAVLN